MRSKYIASKKGIAIMNRLIKGLLQWSVLPALATTTAVAQLQLGTTIALDEYGNGAINGNPTIPYLIGQDDTGGIPPPFSVLSYILPRSEERRVGKECRSR